MGEEKPFPRGKPAAALVPVSWEDVGSDRTYKWKRRPLGPLVDNCAHRPGEQRLTPAVAASPDVELPTDDDPLCSSVNGSDAPRGRAQVRPQQSSRLDVRRNEPQ